MNQREMRRALEGVGFWLEREGSRHYLYTNGTMRVPLSKGSGNSPHIIRQFRMIIRREKQRLEEKVE